MDCDKYLELLCQRLDGLLSPEEEAFLREHSSRCPACRTAGVQLAELRAGFAALAEFPAPEGFADGVMARVRQERAPKVIPLFRRPQVRVLASLAACLVLAAGLYRAALYPREDAWTNQLQRDAGLSLAAAPMEDTGSASDGGAALPYCAAQDGEDGSSGTPAASEPKLGARASNALAAASLSDHAVLVLERMPEGAEALIPPETAVTRSSDTGEEGYRWLDTGREPEVLDQIEQLAREQDIPAARPDLPADPLYHLVILLPQT